MVWCAFAWHYTHRVLDVVQMPFKQYAEKYSFGVSKPVTIVSSDVTIGWKQHVQISPVISMGELAVKTAIGFTVQSRLAIKIEKDPNIFQERIITYSFKNNRGTIDKT